MLLLKLGFQQDSIWAASGHTLLGSSAAVFVHQDNYLRDTRVAIQIIKQGDTEKSP